MILPQCRLLPNIHLRCNYSGLDSIQDCLDLAYFKNYPYSVNYQYNSRGYRDHEWPDTVDNLKNSIWCIGDSFTVGLGSPFNHIWPQVLQETTNIRTINISMDGASNNWIARHANYIINEINPRYVVIHWSFSHRRELPLESMLDPIWQEYYQAIKDPTWPSCDSYNKLDQLPEHIQEEVKQDPKFNSWQDGFDIELPRRLRDIRSSDSEDIINTQQCIDSLLPGPTIIHSFIPDWHSKPTELNFHDQPRIKEFARLDLARDGFHYDMKTSQFFCQQIIDFLN